MRSDPSAITTRAPPALLLSFRVCHVARLCFQLYRCLNVALTLPEGLICISGIVSKANESTDVREKGKTGSLRNLIYAWNGVRRGSPFARGTMLFVFAVANGRRRCLNYNKIRSNQPSGAGDVVAFRAFEPFGILSDPNVSTALLFFSVHPS